MLVEIETNIQDTINIHSSLITISSNHKFEPRITNEISNKQELTDYLCRRYKRNKSEGVVASSAGVVSASSEEYTALVSQILVQAGYIMVRLLGNVLE